MGHRRSLLAAVLCAAICGASGVAHAQASAEDKAAAEALFDAARTLMKDGKYAEACAKFEQSQQIDPGIGTLLYLGDCYEKVGKLASAWATFREGASRAQATGQTDRARAGEQRAQALLPRLSRMNIQVAAESRALEGFRLSRGDQEVEPALFGVATPVDAGKYQIRATAPGYEPWTQNVQIDKEGEVVTVTVPALAKAAGSEAPEEPPPAPPPAVVTPTPPAPPADTPPEDAVDPGATQRTIGLVVGGAGVVGIGIGALFGLNAISKNSDAEEFCPRGDRCDDPRGVTLTDEAKDAATISNIAFGLGGAALVGGAVLFFTAPSAAESAYVAPLVGTRGGGLRFGGTF